MPKAASKQGTQALPGWSALFWGPGGLLGLVAGGGEQGGGGDRGSGLLLCNELQLRLPPWSSLLSVQCARSSSLLVLSESSMAVARGQDPTSLFGCTRSNFGPSVVQRLGNARALWAVPLPGEGRTCWSSVGRRLLALAPLRCPRMVSGPWAYGPAIPCVVSPSHHSHFRWRGGVAATREAMFLLSGGGGGERHAPGGGGRGRLAVSSNFQQKVLGKYFLGLFTCLKHCLDVCFETPTSF